MIKHSHIAQVLTGAIIVVILLILASFASFSPKKTELVQLAPQDELSPSPRNESPEEPNPSVQNSSSNTTVFGGGGGGSSSSGTSSYQCSDSSDNDNDGFIDLNDPGCIDSSDDSETLSDAEFSGMSTEYAIEKFNNYTNSSYYFNNSMFRYALTLNNSYDSEDALSAFITMYEATQNASYIGYALLNAENITSRLINYTDSVSGNNYTYLAWQDLISGYDHDSNISTPNRTSCLYTERGIRQFARLARIIKTNPILNETYRERADVLIDFIKHDILNSPECYLRHTPQSGTFHILSHSSYILLQMYLLEGNITYFNSTLYPAYANLGYLDTVTYNFNNMRTHLFENRNDSKAVVWHSTPCTEINYSEICYTLNVSCRSSGHTYGYCYPGDVSHQDDSIEAIIEAYRAGIVFNITDINTFAYTLSHIIWNKNISSPKFYDIIDGNNRATSVNGVPYFNPPQGSQWPWVHGSSFAPGFAGLGAFSLETQRILELAETNYVLNYSWMSFSPGYNGNWLSIESYYSQLAKNKIIETCQYTNRATEICDSIDNDCDGAIDENLDC